MWCVHTGWRRLIGSPKLLIIVHKRATKYKALLRKMTYKDKGSYESSAPCNTCREFVYEDDWPTVCDVDVLYGNDLYGVATVSRID